MCVDSHNAIIFVLLLEAVGAVAAVVYADC